MSKKEITMGEACRTILRSGRDAIFELLTFKNFTLTDNEISDDFKYDLMTKEKPKPGTLTDARPKRARGKKGKFLADDKSTAYTNEAWVGGKAPKKKRKKTTRKKK